MEYVINESILLKDIDEEEFLQQSGEGDEEELLSDIVAFLAGKGPDDGLTAEIQGILSRIHRAKRVFGLYENGEYFGHIALSDYDTATPEIHIELKTALYYISKTNTK